MQSSLRICASGRTLQHSFRREGYFEVHEFHSCNFNILSAHLQVLVVQTRPPTPPHGGSGLGGFAGEALQGVPCVSSSSCRDSLVPSRSPASRQVVSTNARLEWSSILQRLAGWQSPLWPVGSGGHACASGEAGCPTAFLAGTEVSRVGYVNKGLRDSWTLYPLPVTPFTVVNAMGCLHLGLDLCMPPNPPTHSSLLVVLTGELAPGELAASGVQ